MTTKKQTIMAVLAAFMMVVCFTAVSLEQNDAEITAEYTIEPEKSQTITVSVPTEITKENVVAGSVAVTVTGLDDLTIDGTMNIGTLSDFDDKALEGVFIFYENGSAKPTALSAGTTLLTLAVDAGTKSGSASIKVEFKFTTFDGSSNGTDSLSLEYMLHVVGESITISYYADNEKVADVTFMKGTEFTEPSVPAKSGFSGKWPTYDVTKSGRVDAVYTVIDYTATFVSDLVKDYSKTVTFNALTPLVAPTTMPEYPGYDVAWEDFVQANADMTIKAVYTPKEYTMSFVADDVTVKTITFTVETDKSSLGIPSVPSKTGYTGVWSGWDAYTISASNKTFTAAYTPIDYTLKYDSNGGSAISDATVAYDALLVKPSDDPTLAGSKFAGWFYDKAFTNPVDFTSDLMTGDMTIYAKWIADDQPIYTVKSGDETSYFTEFKVTTGDIVSAPTSPEKVGYTFAGWYTDSALTEAMDFSKAISTYTEAMTSNVLSLYAKWTPVTYKIEFYAEGVLIDTRTYTVETDVSKLVNPEVPTKAGYDVTWKSYTIDKSAPADIVVDAVYTAKEYTATFKANGAVVSTVKFTATTDIVEPAVPNKAGYTGAWEAYAKAYSDITINAVYTPIKYTLTLKADGTVVKTLTFTKETKVADLNIPGVPEKTGYAGSWPEIVLGTQDLTVEAVYVANTYNVYTKVQDKDAVLYKENVAYGSTIAAPDAPNTNYFAGWYLDADCTQAVDFATFTITGETTLYAKIVDSDPIEISFNTDGGSAVTTIYLTEAGKISEPDAPTKQYYDFKGWFTDNNYGTAFNFTQAISADTVIYAKFTAHEYTVTFMADGVKKGTDTYTVLDKTISAPALPTKTGYTVTWADAKLDFTDETVEAIYTAITYKATFVANGSTVEVINFTVADVLSTMVPEVPMLNGYSGVWEDFTQVAKDMTINAVYTAEQFTLYFSVDGSVVKTIAFTIETSKSDIALPTIPAKTGYIGSWPDFELGSGDMTVEAVYTAEVYDLNTSVNGVVTKIGDIYYGGSVAKPSDPSVDPKKFAGWYVDSGFTQPIDFASYVVDGPVTLYAKIYEAEDTTYTVSFESNGGSAVEDRIVKTGGTIAEPELAEREGYTFGGWFSDPELTQAFNFSTAITKNTVLYAKWTAITYQLTFVADGKTVEVVTVSYGQSTIDEPAVPAKAGYSGVWAAYTIGESQTVEAIYTVIEYTATFKATGFQDVLVTFSVKTALVEPEVPTVQGYTVAWATYELEYKDFTVYAVMTPIQYTITFVADGTTMGTVDYTVETELSSITAPAITKTKTGYTATWPTFALGTESFTVNAVYTLMKIDVYKDINGTTTKVGTYTYGDVVEDIGTPDNIGDNNMFAGWFMSYSIADGYANQVTFPYTIAVEENITFYAKIVTKDGKITVKFNGDGINLADVVLSTSDSLQKPTLSKDGYESLVWYTDASMQNPITSFPVLASSLQATDGVVNLYSKWVLIEYTITFNDGTKVTYVNYDVEHKQITEPTVTPVDNYNGVWEEYSITTGDFTVNAVYTAIEYTATFKATGFDDVIVKFSDADPLTEDKIPAVPVRNGYTVAWDMPATISLADQTINAVFTPIEYTLTFVSGPSNDQTTSSVKFTVETEVSDIVKPDIVAIKGYTSAWPEIVLGSADMTVNAVYTPITYSINFYTADGFKSIVYVTIEAESVKAPAVPEKTGYVGEWADFTDAWTAFKSNPTVNESGYIFEVLGSYTAVTYYVTFVLHDGTQIGTSIPFTVSDEYVAVPAISGLTNEQLAAERNLGYVAAKWAGQTTATISNEVKEVVSVKNITENITVSIADDIREIAITFSGATNQIEYQSPYDAAMSVKFGQSIVFPTADAGYAAKSGYKLIGWALTDADGRVLDPANTAVTSDLVGPTVDALTIYAKTISDSANTITIKFYDTEISDMLLEVDGTTNKAKFGSVNNIPVLSVQGKVFIGWYLESSFTTLVDKDTEFDYTTSSVYTIYPRVIEQAITVTFMNGNSPIATTSVEYESYVSYSQDKPVSSDSKKTYFVGWSTDPEAYADVLDLSTIKQTGRIVEGSISYTAVYYAVFQVRGDVNGDTIFNYEDAIRALYHVMYPDVASYNICQDMDVNGDGVEDQADVLRMLYSYLFDGKYDLKDGKAKA